jgi:hypothetical protein
MTFVWTFINSKPEGILHLLFVLCNDSRDLFSLQQNDDFYTNNIATRLTLDSKLIMFILIESINYIQFDLNKK